MSNILEDHKRSYPSSFYRKKSDSMIEKILTVIAAEDEKIANDIKAARAQRILMTSEGKYLSNWGARYKINRPRGFKTTEAVYREIVRLIAFYPKQIRPIFEKLAELFWGERALVDDIVQIYNIEPSKIDIIIQAIAPIVAARFDLLNATYLHETHDLYDPLKPPFPSAYTFEPASYSTLNPPTHPIGSLLLDISINQDDFPTTPFTVAVGNADNYEVKYATGRTGDYIYLANPTIVPHNAGEQVYIPKYITHIETTLNQIVTAGTKYPQLLLTNSADFPDRNGALYVAFDKTLRDHVPYKSRPDNNRVLLDPDYVFQNSYSIGTPVTLCCVDPQVNRFGRDYAFKLTDTEAMREYIVELFNRVKREGVRLNITFE